MFRNLFQKIHNLRKSYPTIREFLITVLHEIRHALDRKKLGVKRYEKEYIIAGEIAVQKGGDFHDDNKFEYIYMKSRSAKNKGKRLQNKVRDLILEKFNQLEPDDVRSTTMGDSGEDVLLSPAARRLFPFSVECKNQEKLNIWSSLEQAENNSGTHTPLLIFKRNRTKTYAVLQFDKLLELLDEPK